MALKTSCRMDGGVNPSGLWALSRLVSEASGHVLPVSKPVTGESAFLHESGIHCAGLLRDRATYEPFSSGEVGGADPGFLIGKHSGSAAIMNIFRENGLTLDPAKLPALMEKIRQAAMENKGALSTGQLLELAGERETQ